MLSQKTSRRLSAAGAICVTLLAGCSDATTGPGAPAPRFKTVETRPLVLDRIYRSMTGPMERVDVDYSDVDWITGLRTDVVDAGTNNAMGGEFFCHSQLQILDGVRLTVMATGLQEMHFPPGFGIPTGGILASIPPDARELNFLGMLLNNHVPDIDRHARVRCRIEYQADEDLDGPMRRLYPAHAVMTVEDLEVYCPPEQALGNVDVTTHCAYVAGSPSHWVVPSGKQTTRLRMKLGIPSATPSTVHYIATHMHNNGEYVRLTDTVTGEVLWQADVEHETERRQITSITTYSSADGFMVYPDREYELEAFYDNTSDVDVDAMAVMYLYFSPQDNALLQFGG